MAWKAFNGTGILVYVTFFWLVRLVPFLEPLTTIGSSLIWAGLKVQTFEDCYVAAAMIACSPPCHPLISMCVISYKLIFTVVFYSIISVLIHGRS